MEPLVRTPQVTNVPALTDENSPGGGVDCPYSSLPQHASTPSVRTPHEWKLPVLTD